MTFYAIQDARNVFIIAECGGLIVFGEKELNMVSTFKEKCFWCSDTIELIPLFAKQDKHTEGWLWKGSICFFIQ